ncbi:hypothetical protein PIB30_024488 [Stylosanthes scabra]|uniref:Ubiquinol-cytochrome c chaperone domain-containing protein n=1 Tax=Stylosanthes scabra TaxID=79078 RepID=A0ABU6Y8J9_9FABA|nr:hypothetical protein [Stylosanthes scabra]
MLQRWSRAFSPLCKARSLNAVSAATGTRHSYARVATAPEPPAEDKPSTPQPPPVNLDKMFWSKPFDKPPIYEVFNLEKTFKTTFTLLVLHMWLCLRRLKQEGKEGAEFGQYLYEIYNHDVELRVSKAGVNLLLTKWMKELEKMFYGNIVAYDTAMLPEAKSGDLAYVLWRNIFSDDGSSMPDASASQFVNAMARYTRREVSCMTLTDKEALYSGNFMFTPLKHESKSAKAHK